MSSKLRFDNHWMCGSLCRDLRRTSQRIFSSLPSTKFRRLLDISESPKHNTAIELGRGEENWDNDPGSPFRPIIS